MEDRITDDELDALIEHFNPTFGVGKAVVELRERRVVAAGRAEDGDLPDAMIDYLSDFQDGYMVPSQVSRLMAREIKRERAKAKRAADASITGAAIISSAKLRSAADNLTPTDPTARDHASRIRALATDRAIEGGV